TRGVEVSVEGVFRLAFSGIEQQNLTILTGCSHQFAIRRNRQSFIDKSSRNTLGHLVWAAGQIVESDFIAGSMGNSHDQNASVRRKARRDAKPGGWPWHTEVLVDKHHDLPGFDIPGTQDVRLLSPGQVIPILTEAEGNQPRNIVRQFDSTASR